MIKMLADAIENYFKEIELDINDPLYDDVFSVHFAIKRLLERNIISEREIEIFRLHIFGYSYREIGNIINIDHREILRKEISDIIQKILKELMNEISNE